MSGYTGQQSELYYSLPSAVTRSNYVTATQAVMTALTTTSVPRCVIPALYFSQIGKSLHFEANGTVVGTAAAPTFIMAAGLNLAAGTLGGTGGGTIVTAPATTTAPGTTTWPWTMEVDIVCQAVGGAVSGTAGGTTLQCNGEIDVHSGATNTWQTGRQTNMFGTTITSLNNEVNLFLELHATWTGTVTASNITVVQQLKVYLEN